MRPLILALIVLAASGCAGHRVLAPGDSAWVERGKSLYHCRAPSAKEAAPVCTSPKWVVPPDAPIPED